MATTGPSIKSYAEIAKAYCPPHAEVLKANRPHAKTAASRTIPSEQPGVHQEDEWTDISSVTSCSWPSELDDGMHL